MNAIEQNSEWRAQQHAERPERPGDPEAVRAYRAVATAIRREPPPAPPPDLVERCRLISRREIRRQTIHRRLFTACLMVAAVAVFVLGLPGLARLAAAAAGTPWPMLLTALVLTVSGAELAGRVRLRASGVNKLTR